MLGATNQQKLTSILSHAELAVQDLSTKTMPEVTAMVQDARRTIQAAEGTATAATASAVAKPSFGAAVIVAAAPNKCKAWRRDIAIIFCAIMFKSYSVKQAPGDTYKEKHKSLTSDRKMFLSSTPPPTSLNIDRKESNFATVTT